MTKETSFEDFSLDLTAETNEEEEEEDDSGILDVYSPTSSSESLEDYDYQILPLDEVIQKIRKMADDLAAVIALPPPAIRRLLHHFSYNSEKLINHFTSAEAAEVLLADTVYLDLTEALSFHQYQGSCQLCCCDDVLLKSLRCNHECCADCWNDYIKAQVDGEGTVDIGCFEAGCGLKLMDEQVHSLIQEQPLREHYDRLLAKIFVESNAKLQWCHGAGCTMVVKLSITSKPLNVYCDSCGSDFCPACNKSAHLPLSCAHFKTWTDGKTPTDLESIEWIAKNSRPCPKCKVPIEKSGGCNYMDCKSCQAPFCWQCMTVLTKTHDERHACQRFDGVFETPEHEDLQRFQHYMNRFLNHRNSEAAEVKLLEDMTSFCGFLTLLHDLPAYKIQMCKKALQELLQSRRVLAYSCAFAYYLKDEPSRHIFETNVEHLEQFTEHTSLLFDVTSPFWESHDQLETFQTYLSYLQDKMKHLRACRATLLDHACECVDNQLC